MQVTIYRVDSGFRNVQDGLTLNEPPSDVTYTSTLYDLPDGYTTEVDQFGRRYILDDQGKVMDIALRNNTSKSAVLLIGENKMIALHKAAEAMPVNTIRAARLKAGLTQQQLSNASGVNIRQIQRIELGSSDAGNLTARNLLAIADALGVDPHELI